MALDVGQPLLGGAVERQALQEGHRGQALGQLQADLQPGGLAKALHQALQGTVQRQIGLQRGAQGGHRPAQLAQGIRDLGAHRLDQLDGPLGVAGDQALRRFKLHRGDGQVVSQGVVHLTRQAVTLFRDSQFLGLPGRGF